jgi:hypothetical protein
MLDCHAASFCFIHNFLTKATNVEALDCENIFIALR